jgi:flavin-dependent dehydrogenase
VRADLAIVGLGTAGAALAGFAARAGLSVIGLERRPLAEAGARWINGVPERAFDACGLARPSGAERFGGGHAFHLLAGRGPKRIVLRDHGVLEVDMRLLVARLQAKARDAGAELRENVRVTGFDGRTLETTRGAVTARWFVDASGLAGARLLDQPRLSPRDICSAAQQVHAVTDLGSARAFFERHGVAPGDTLCFTAVAGGYSILSLRLEGDRVGILTGSIPAEGHPSGLELVQRFVAEERWVGARLFGGSRAVPLGLPRARLAHERVALLGDAACQVFSAHGSGIGAGLVAARMLSDALANAEDPWAYSVAWQRRFGGLFAIYDEFRRFSQSLDPDEVERLFDAELLDARGALAGLRQELPRPDLAQLRRVLGGAVRELGLARRFARVLTRGAAFGLLYARYPEDPARLADWAARLGRITDATNPGTAAPMRASRSA